jgi:hypothetical protein
VPVWTVIGAPGLWPGNPSPAWTVAAAGEGGDGGRRGRSQWRRPVRSPSVRAAGDGGRRGRSQWRRPARSPSVREAAVSREPPRESRDWLLPFVFGGKVSGGLSQKHFPPNEGATGGLNEKAPTALGLGIEGQDLRCAYVHWSHDVHGIRSLPGWERRENKRTAYDKLGGGMYGRLCCMLT